MLETDSLPIVFASLEKDTVMACVDARQTQPFAGTPGGHTGELVLLLTALEAQTGEQLWPTDVFDWVWAHAERFGTFYLHTDDRALALVAKIAGTPWTLRPSRKQRVRLLAALGRSRAIGCKHMSKVAGQPDAYGVRLEVVLSVIRAFFLALWRGDERMVFDVLHGKVKEQGVVVYERSAKLPRPKDALTLHSHDPAQGAVFSLHGPAIAYYRATAVEWAADRAGLGPEQRTSLAQRVEALSQRQLDLTLAAVASHLPIERRASAG